VAEKIAVVIDAKDLIYEGIATVTYKPLITFNIIAADAKDLIYEGIATSIMSMIEFTIPAPPTPKT